MGIDEVGRGSWAGPLVVGACVLNGAKIEGLTDSKALSKKQRENLAAKIEESSAIVGLGWVSNVEIDSLGLSESLRLATRRAVKEAQRQCKAQNVQFSEIIIDGTVNFLAETPFEKYVSTLKKADLLISSVSAAAISAKVARDKFMAELSKKPEFSNYGFENHAGYGTAKHRAALAEFGASKMHRQSFKPITELTQKSPATKPIKNDDKITTKQIGDLAEEKVAEFLAQDGHQILARNWKNKFCEIDIVSKKGQKYYFTEVKFRKNAVFGGGESAISKKKIRQMRFAAEFFLHQEKLGAVDAELLGAVVQGADFEIQDIFEIES